MMLKHVFLAAGLFISACATFDKTNILPGQRVPGPGFSFTVPTDNTWFTVEYGTGNRIKLSQLNNNDSYSILVSINRGPYWGMYRSAEAHLKDVQSHHHRTAKPAGYIEHKYEAWVDARYGKLCVRSAYSAEDWRGRNNEGAALIEAINLSCPHPELPNVLISTQLSRRYEKNGESLDLRLHADALFASFEFQEID
jgi:hypothetical protein